MDPIEFPAITIGARTLKLKISFLAKYRMAQLGIRPADFRMFVPGANDPGIIALMMKLFSCAVADNFVDPDRPSAPVEIPTPEYWAATIPEAQWQEVCDKTMQALVKAIPPAAARPLADDITGAIIPN